MRHGCGRRSGWAAGRLCGRLGRVLPPRAPCIARPACGGKRRRARGGEERGERRWAQRQVRRSDELAGSLSRLGPGAASGSGPRSGPAALAGLGAGSARPTRWPWPGAGSPRLAERGRASGGNAQALRRRGVRFAVLLAALALATGVLLEALLAAAGATGWLLEAAIVAALLSQRELHWRASRLFAAVEQGGAEAGRPELHHLAGRDAAPLGEGGGCDARAWSRSPRTSATGRSPPPCGFSSSACRGCSSTKRPTRRTPSPATTTTAGAISGAPARSGTTSSTGSRPALPPPASLSPRCARAKRGPGRLGPPRGGTGRATARPTQAGRRRPSRGGSGRAPRRPALLFRHGGWRTLG